MSQSQIIQEEKNTLTEKYICQLDELKLMIKQDLNYKINFKKEIRQINFVKKRLINGYY